MKISIVKNNSEFHLIKIKVLRKITRNIGLLKVSFRIENLANLKPFLNCKIAKLTAEFYENKISPTQVFNDKNVENQKFELNYKTEKLSK